MRTKVARATFDPGDDAGTSDLLWSKGLARLCDVAGPPGYRLARTEAVQESGVIGEAFGEASGLVWIRLGSEARLGRTCDLDRFAVEALPRISRPFILVTGDGDISVPGDLRPETVARLLASPLLVAWLTQNHDGGGDNRIAPLPIGLDLHTPRPFDSPRRLAEALRSIAAERVAAAAQPLSVFCDAGLALSPERARAVDALAGCDHVVMAPRRLPQRAIWRRYASHPFVLSAPGNGLDCHRTWEALYLGSMVIARRSALDPLYDGLPVLLVDDWGDIRDRALLEEFRAAHAASAKSGHVERLLDARARLAAWRARLS
ncbi:MAG TPA: hypothetical protein VIZ90_07170 [Rhizobiaceae bacterium]